MKRLHLIIRGRVQGVFFRAFVNKYAHLLNLTGFVRNKSDGTVEAVAEGDAKHLEMLYELCKTGPPGAKVDKIEKREEKASGKFKDFQVRY